LLFAGLGHGPDHSFVMHETFPEEVDAEVLG